MTVGAAVTGNQNKITVLAVFVDFGIPSKQKRVPQTPMLGELHTQCACIAHTLSFTRRAHAHLYAMHACT